MNLQSQVQGTVAFEIHSACNRLLTAIQIAENGSTPQDELRQMTEWLSTQPIFSNDLLHSDDNLEGVTTSPTDNDGVEQKPIS